MINRKQYELLKLYRDETGGTIFLRTLNEIRNMDLLGSRVNDHGYSFAFVNYKGLWVMYLYELKHA